MNWKKTLKGKYKFIITGILLIASIAWLSRPHQLNPTLQKDKILIFITDNSNIIHPLKLIRAISPAEEESGLMFVGYLPSDTGMIFISPQEKHQSFWMYNTFIPLDLIFVNGNNKVVHIFKNVKAHQTDPLISPAEKAKYVIELNGGTVNKMGINIDSEIIFKVNQPTP